MKLEEMIDRVKLGQNPERVFSAGLTEMVQDRITAVPGVFNTSRDLTAPVDSPPVVSGFARGSDMRAAKNKKPSEPKFRDVLGKKGRYLREEKYSVPASAVMNGLTHGAIGTIHGGVLGAGYHGLKHVFGSQDHKLTKAQRRELLRKRIVRGAKLGGALGVTAGAIGGASLAHDMNQL